MNMNYYARMYKLKKKIFSRIKIKGIKVLKYVKEIKL